MHVWRGVLVAMTMCFAGCGQTEAPASSSPRFFAPPDVGDVSHFNSCTAKPRRVVSPREACEMKALAARCTPADDCLVSCIASPEGFSVGGACWHVCFSAMHVRGQDPIDWAQCAVLPLAPHG
jgi:hypothetical protein